MDQEIQSEELKKVRQLLSQNIDDFKNLMLWNMRLEEKQNPTEQPLHLDVNRISNFQIRNEESVETLEQWVARQDIKSKKTKSASSQNIVDLVEKWLMNEAKKDLFAEMDAVYGNAQQMSGTQIREIAINLLSLADKLDRIKS